MSLHAFLEGLADRWLLWRQVRRAQWERKMLRSLRIGKNEPPPKGIVVNIREPNK
jgi:hypothetical protein